MYYKGIKERTLNNLIETRKLLLDYYDDYPEDKILMSISDLSLEIQLVDKLIEDESFMAKRFEIIQYISRLPA